MDRGKEEAIPRFEFLEAELGEPSPNIATLGRKGTEVFKPPTVGTNPKSASVFEENRLPHRIQRLIERNLRIDEIIDKLNLSK